MDENNQNLEVTPEEQKAEEEATKEVNFDDLREKVAEDLGIDPDDEDQQELLERVVEREKANHERFVGVLKQKISWREKANAASAKPKENPKDGKSVNVKNLEDIDKIVEERIEARLQARELMALGLPEEIEAEVKDLANLKGISVREASELPYIKDQRERYERQQRLQQAAPRRSKKGVAASVDFDITKPLNPEDFRTSDGNLDVEAWDSARAARQKYLKEQSS